MRIWCLSLFACVSVTAAAAEEWAVRSGDMRLNAQQVSTMTTGRTLEFFDGGRSKYSAGGSYSYTYEGGGTAYGTFDIDADGTICVAFKNGFSRCDRLVQSSGRLVLLTQSGARFPVRSHE